MDSTFALCIMCCFFYAIFLQVAIFMNKIFFPLFIFGNSFWWICANSEMGEITAVSWYADHSIVDDDYCESNNYTSPAIFIRIKEETKNYWNHNNKCRHSLWQEIEIKVMGNSTIWRHSKQIIFFLFGDRKKRNWILKQ